MYANWILCAVASLIVANAQSSDSRAGQRQLRGSVASVMRNDDAVASEGTASSLLASFGPLEKLIGTWQGQRGISVVSLPQYAYGSADFMVLGYYYNETLTFRPIWGQVLNRGYSNANHLNPTAQLDQVLMGLTYDLRVVNSVTGDLIHAESGQWLWNRASGIDPQWTVSRASLIPHGVSLIALGEVSSLTGTEVEDELQGMKYSVDWISEPQNLQSNVFGYFEGKRAAGCNDAGGNASQGDCDNPILRLLEDIGPVQNMSAKKLEVSSLRSGGAIAMLPNVQAQVQNKAFNATFYVETITDSQNQTYEQLQYAQNVFFQFETNFACRSNPVTSLCDYSDSKIHWPHIQVNTLRKIEGMPSRRHHHDHHEESKTPKTQLPYIR